jgi:hypothetical protein
LGRLLDANHTPEVVACPDIGVVFQMRVDGVPDLAMEVERGLRLRAVEVRDVRLVDTDKVAVTAVVRRVRREKLMDCREGPRDLGQVEELDLLAVDERVERVE